MSPNSNNNNHHFTLESVLTKLESVCEDILEIKNDIKELRAIVDKDLVTLKLESQTCKAHWGMVRLVISLGGLGAVGGTLVNLILGAPHK